MPTTTQLTFGHTAVAEALGRLREQPPLLHCLTNIVVAGFTANVLLALGASPAMVENVDEAAPFAAIAGGVLVNLGTLSRERAEAARLAAASAHQHGVSWVHDPVAGGAREHRTRLAADLVGDRPTIIRGNGSEIQALAGAVGASVRTAGGRGVDSLATSEEALDAADGLARASGAVVAVSGAVDYVTDGTSTLAVPGGVPVMTRVTGVGCALGAVMAALCAAGNEPAAAAGAASALFAAAGERAAGVSAGPGSWAVAFLDALDTLAGPGAAA